MDFLTKCSGYENSVLFTQYDTHIQLNLPTADCWLLQLLPLYRPKIQYSCRS
jgi:hypothetical protein